MEGPGGGCSTPGWSAGPGCSPLAVEEGMGRWGLRGALRRAEHPVQGGKRSPSTLHACPSAGTHVTALQVPAAPAAAVPAVHRGGISSETQPRCATAGNPLTFPSSVPRAGESLSQPWLLSCSSLAPQMPCKGAADVVPVRDKDRDSPGMLWTAPRCLGKAASLPGASEQGRVEQPMASRSQKQALHQQTNSAESPQGLKRGGKVLKWLKPIYYVH